MKKILLSVLLILGLVSTGWCAGYGTDFDGSDRTQLLNAIFNTECDLNALEVHGLTTLTGVIQGASPLVFEGLTANAHETTFAIADPSADRTITFPNSSGTVVLTAIDEQVFEGTTADEFETTLSATDPTADNSVVLANASGTVMLSSLATNAPDAANSVTGASNGLVFEGSGVDAHEAIIQATNPTADTIWALPVAAAGTYSLMSSTLATNAPDIANSVYGVSNGLTFEGATANEFETTLAPTDPTADATITIPNRTGTVMLKPAAAVALTPGAAVTLTVGVGETIYTDTPTDNEDQTITFSAAGTLGDKAIIIFNSAGAGDEVITFHATLVSSTGTLTIGTDASKYYVITFVSSGSHWYEVSRTAVQT